MLSNLDTKNWLSTFDDECQEFLVNANSLESWPIDSDVDIQTHLDEISNVMHQQSPEDGDSDLDYSALLTIPVEDLVKLQGQLGFIKGLKLFGDICYVDDTLAMDMLSHHKELFCEDQNLSISSSILTRRLYLLIKMQLISKVFCNSRQDQVVKTLKQHFNKGNVDGHEK